MKIETQLRFYKRFEDIDPVCHFSGYVVTDETWHQDPLYASYSRLYYVTEGSGFLVSENERIQLEPGYVYLAPSGIKCGFYGTPSITKLFFHINIPLGDEAGDAFDSYGHFARLPRSVEYIEQLRRWYVGGEDLGYLMLKSEILRTVSEFLSEKGEPVSHEEPLSKVVSEAARYIRANLTASLTVKSVTDAIHCSQSKLLAAFRSEVGKSVSGYIEDLLMSEAQTMLMYGDLSIGEISERLGFCDQFYFSRRFSKRFGIPPKKYRKSLSGAPELNK
jgi:AraC-like DNA-binding protein